MKVFKTKKELNLYFKEFRSKNTKIGFVPTMGALHKGHLSLLEKSSKENDITIASIFVNPTQFNKKEDLENYPRTLENDLNLLKNIACDVVFIPSVEEIYTTTISSGQFDFDGLENEMEGKYRKGHFNGVGTVVKKLFEIVLPTYAYFGEKDFQQLQIIRKLVKKTSIFIIPLFIIIIFIVLYRNSNPVFDELVTDFLNFISNYLALLFKNIDLTLFFTVLICLFISNIIIFKAINKKIIDSDINASFILKRTNIKKNRFFKFNDLKNEYKAGIFLLIVLNILILILNLIDINWVWFNFKWEGQFLKQFVHEGTYLLILSILISIGLVLFFFRENLNFYSKNRTLKYLSYVWIIQNGILTISVAIRNFYYINYFSLAYKRIGILLFLILTLYGLYTVFNKVKNKKTNFYLFQYNFSALFILLIVSSIVNWDKVIANYNFKHANKSFLELNYLVDFSDKTLPYLDKPELMIASTSNFQLISGTLGFLFISFIFIKIYLSANNDLAIER